MNWTLEKELESLIKLADKLTAKHAVIYYITKCDCGSLDLTTNNIRKKIVYDTKSKNINRSNL